MKKVLILGLCLIALNAVATEKSCEDMLVHPKSFLAKIFVKLSRFPTPNETTLKEVYRGSKSYFNTEDLVKFLDHATKYQVTVFVDKYYKLFTAKQAEVVLARKRSSVIPFQFSTFRPGISREMATKIQNRIFSLESYQSDYRAMKRYEYLVSKLEKRDSYTKPTTSNNDYSKLNEIFFSYAKKNNLHGFFEEYGQKISDDEYLKLTKSITEYYKYYDLLEIRHDIAIPDIGVMVYKNYDIPILEPLRVEAYTRGLDTQEMKKVAKYLSYYEDDIDELRSIEKIMTVEEYVERLTSEYTRHRQSLEDDYFQDKLFQ